MKGSVTSHNSGPALAQAFRCTNISVMTWLNILCYLFQVKANHQEKKNKLVLILRTPKQLLLLFVNHAEQSDSQLTKEVPRQVNQNNNKTGVRSSNEERTDPNNGQAVA